MNLDGREFAGFFADTALDTYISIDLVRTLDLSRDSSNRTLTRTSRTSNTLGRIDLIADKLLALSRWTLLVDDMSLILLREVMKR